VTEKLHGLATELDSNFDDKISYEEFAHLIEKPKALTALQDVGISPVGLVDLAELFFFENGNPVELPFEEFMTLVLSLRNTSPATVHDILNMRMEIKTTTNRQIRGVGDSVDFRLDSLTEKVDALTQKVDKNSELLTQTLQRLGASTLP